VLRDRISFMKKNPGTAVLFVMTAIGTILIIGWLNQ
jgi:hypothetical protein